MEIERLKKFRKSLGLNQIEFCEPLGLQQGSYSDIERGKSSITFRMVKELIEKFDLNPLWLFTGLSSMKLNDDSSIAMEDGAPYGNTPNDMESKLLKEQIETLKGENSALKKLVALYESKA